MFRNIKVGPKLLVSMLIAGLLPVGIASYLAYSDTDVALDDAVQDRLNAVMQIKKNQIEGWFSERNGDVQVLAAFYEVGDALVKFDQAYQEENGAKGPKYKAVNDFYNPVLAGYNKTYGYYDLFLIGPTGDVVYSATREADFATNMVKGKFSDSGLADAYRAAMKGNVSLIDFSAYAPSNGAPASFIAAPVNYQGKTVGVVALQMPLGALNKVMQESAGLGETGESYLIGSDMLMRSDSRFEKEPTILKRKVDSLAVREALAGKTGIQVYKDYHGMDAWGAYTPLKINGLNWALVAEIDDEEVMKPLEGIRNESLMVAGILGLLVGLMAFFLARSISKPLRRLSFVAEELAQGEMDHEIEIEGRDELGQLADGFRTMVESIQRVVNDTQSLADAGVAGKLDVRADEHAHKGEFARVVGGINSTIDAMVAPIQEAGTVLRRLSGYDLTARVEGDYKGDHAAIKEDLNATANTLEEAMARVGQSAHQLEGVSGQISEGSENLAESASEQAAALEEVAATISALAEQINAGSGDVHTAQGQAGDARSSAEDGKNAMDDLSTALSTIKSSSDETAKIVRTIDQIAFQTNVLALNAAVEAARAGEAGKGFAVVAEQVGRLAQRTAEASQSTADMIEESVNHSDKGVEYGEKVGVLFEQIHRKAQELDTLMDSLAAGADRQATGVSQIGTAMEQINATTQANASTSEESAAAAQELATSASSLRQMVGQFNISQSLGMLVEPRGASTRRDRRSLSNGSNVRPIGGPIPQQHRIGPANGASKAPSNGQGDAIGSDQVMAFDENELAEFIDG